jgi:hypothetical protein
MLDDAEVMAAYSIGLRIKSHKSDSNSVFDLR